MDERICGLSDSTQIPFSPRFPQNGDFGEKVYNAIKMTTNFIT